MLKSERGVCKTSERDDANADGNGEDRGAR